MNEESFAQLEQYVERAVGPLRATARRKAVAREELTAHLLDVFEQELRHAGGQGDAALTATVRRFGDCDALTRELQASVPAPERLLFFLLYRERFMWRLMILIGVLGTLFGMAVVLPALAKLKHLGALSGRSDIVGPLALGLILGVVIVTAALHLLAWGIARRVAKRA